MKISIKFLDTVKIKDDSGVVFQKGSTHTLEEDSARHWLNRGKAERCETKIVPAKKVQPKKATSKR